MSCPRELRVLRSRVDRDGVVSLCGTLECGDVCTGIERWADDRPVTEIDLDLPCPPTLTRYLWVPSGEVGHMTRTGLYLSGHGTPVVTSSSCP